MQNALGGAFAAGVVGAEPATALLTGIGTAAGVRFLPEVVRGTARGWRMGRLLAAGDEFRSYHELASAADIAASRPFHQEVAGGLSALGRVLSYVKPEGWTRGALDAPEWVDFMSTKYHLVEGLDQRAKAYQERVLKVMGDGGFLGPEGFHPFAAAQAAAKRVQRLAPLMEETPSGALLSEEGGLRYREAMRVKGYSDKEINTALGMRQVYDEFAHELVDRGVLKEEDLVDSFLPRILDRRRFWRSFADSPRLLNEGYVAGLDSKMSAVARRVRGR